MKKRDIVNEVAKTTLTKKEAVMAVEIFLGMIKKTLKRETRFSFLALELLVLLKEKPDKEEIQRLVRQSKLLPNLRRNLGQQGRSKRL
jgi:nucleoid DNA-binding protein